MGAVELFVQANHLKRLGQEVKKIGPTQIPRENTANIEMLVKQQCCITRLNEVGIEFKAPCHICVCACLCPSVCVCQGKHLYASVIDWCDFLQML